MTDTSVFFSQLARGLEGNLARDRDTLVPPAYQDLWQTPRFSTWYGGRSAAKSWSIARVLLILAHETTLRVLCCREIQGSLKESAYRLLADQIQILQLEDDYDVQADSITHKRTGSRFFFEGLRYNSNKIRSYEGVDLVWVEEAQAVSDLSWETLLPTIRKAGSRFYISFNPLQVDEPCFNRFVENAPPNSIVHKTSYRDNPHLSAEAEAERAWLEKTDPDAYRHVWEGFPREVSDALILRGKFEVAEFAVQPSWAGPFHGLDYGFSRDPSAAVKCYIDDETRTLYVTHEFWELGADIDALPGALEAAIPGISRHVVYADSARPESTSYIARNGIPNARSAEKWPGSVDDGIAYLRSFAKIVVDPSCKHFLDECRSYSFKTDRLTGVPLPEPEDKNNHLIDALRYALSPLIRNLPVGGYLNRAAFLIQGEPIDSTHNPNTPFHVYMTAAMCVRPGSAIGVITWAESATIGIAATTMLDYELVEVEEAMRVDWLERLFERAQALRAAWRVGNSRTPLFVEPGDLLEALQGKFMESPGLMSRLPACDIIRISRPKYPSTLDERLIALRASVNGGSFVKLARDAYTKQVVFRTDTNNALIAQLLGYRPGARDAAQELVGAFAFGCLLARDGDRRRLVKPTQAPIITPMSAENSPRPTRAPCRPRAFVRLRVGMHIIDGVDVEIVAPPQNPKAQFVDYEVTPHVQHIIDGRNAVVQTTSMFELNPPGL